MRGAVRASVLLLGLSAIGVALHALPHGLDPAMLDRFVAHRSLSGSALFVAVAAAGCATGLPRQVAAFFGGYAFGVYGGLALAMAAQMIACIVDFGWARFLARSWVARHRGRRLAQIDAFLAANPFRATLTLRLLPVGNNLLLNLVAGVSSISAIPFLAASALGYVPQTLIFALLGGGVRVSEGAQVAVAVALFAISLALGVLLLRGRRAGLSAGA